MGKKAEQLSDAELFYMLCKEEKNAEAAFAELYNRYSPRVFAYCRRFLQDKDDAKDVFQETFVRFFQCAKQERKMTNVPAFLLKIARNLCVNYRRRDKKLIPLDECYGLQSKSGTENEELLGLIKDAIDQLPDEYKEMFILREYEGFSYTDIADITESSLGTVKIRIYRAKQRIRQLLKPVLKEFSKYDN
jgi:RNA polymerase sigma-70 factor (ECF subfamily)